MNSHTHSNKRVCLNHLRRGRSYEASTRSGTTTRGIYLGIETAHGDQAILLAGTETTRSIRIASITNIHALCMAA